MLLGLHDFIMFKGFPRTGTGPMTAGSTIPVLPASSQLPMPGGLLPSLPGTMPLSYTGPAPWGFLPDGSRCVPNPDGAMPGCCPGTPQDPSFLVGGNRITTADAMDATLARLKPVYGPGSTGNIAKNVTRLQAAGVDATMTSPQALVAAEGAFDTDYLTFDEKSYMPGSGQGENLYGMGQEDPAKPAGDIPWGAIAVGLAVLWFGSRSKRGKE
jgi:hypothetical protein